MHLGGPRPQAQGRGESSLSASHSCFDSSGAFILHPFNPLPTCQLFSRVPIYRRCLGSTSSEETARRLGAGLALGRKLKFSATVNRFSSIPFFTAPTLAPTVPLHPSHPTELCAGPWVSDVAHPGCSSVFTDRWPSEGNINCLEPLC